MAPIRAADPWSIWGQDPADNNPLTLAAVTGSEEEAWALLNESTCAQADRPNMIETRDFASHSDDGIKKGERRNVHVLVTGTENHLEGHEVFASPVDGLARCEDWIARGLHDAQLLEIATNTWLKNDPDHHHTT